MSHFIKHLKFSTSTSKHIYMPYSFWMYSKQSHFKSTIQTSSLTHFRLVTEFGFRIVFAGRWGPDRRLAPSSDSKWFPSTSCCAIPRPWLTRAGGGAFKHVAPCPFAFSARKRCRFSSTSCLVLRCFKHVRFLQSPSPS